jgi:hypothetical protein
MAMQSNCNGSSQGPRAKKNVRVARRREGEKEFGVSNSNVSPVKKGENVRLLSNC